MEYIPPESFRPQGSEPAPDVIVMRNENGEVLGGITPPTYFVPPISPVAESSTETQPSHAALSKGFRYTDPETGEEYDIGAGDHISDAISADIDAERDMIVQLNDERRKRELQLNDRKKSADLELADADLVSSVFRSLFPSKTKAATKILAADTLLRSNEIEMGLRSAYARTINAADMVKRCHDPVQRARLVNLVEAELATLKRYAQAQIDMHQNGEYLKSPELQKAGQRVDAVMNKIGDQNGPIAALSEQLAQGKSGAEGKRLAEGLSDISRRFNEITESIRRMVSAITSSITNAFNR